MKNKIITIVVTTLVTTATLSITGVEYVNELYSSIYANISGCKNHKLCIEKKKIIEREIIGVGQKYPVRVDIREGLKSAPAGFKPTSKKINIVVYDYTADKNNVSNDIYEFDLMRIIDNKEARKLLKDLVIKSNAKSNEFGYSNN